MAHLEAPNNSSPAYFISPPLLKDALETQTSAVQDETVWECLPFLKAIEDPSRSPFDFNEHGVPRLDREEHVEFLRSNLGEFPAPFVGVDSSRPWMVYWGLMGLHLLGEDLAPFRSRVVKTFTSMQNEGGGLGGGQGQFSHLAGSYAAILSLCLVGGTDAYDLINREQMWHWLGRLKQADGGFQICEGGEEDTRGAYCALVIASLLHLPFDLPPKSPARKAGLKTFGDNLGEHLSRCQTYEGGISGTPGSEAHGAYAFCAIACLCLLDDPHLTVTRYLDLDALLSWLSSRQYAPEGGLAGRTNKLVDGCYSHWLGGCWPLIQAALDGPRSTRDFTLPATIGALFSRQGLARYILGCCQAKEGGLRDKPSKRPDSYHTCYNLAGLSMLQHYHYFEKASIPNQFASAFSWKTENHIPSSVPPVESDVFGAADMLPAIHPLYVVPHEAVILMRQWAESLDPIV